MNKNNERKLFKQFVFLNRKNIESIDCGDGWYKLVYDMCKELKPAAPSDFVITKIAEKYGDLEVHSKNGTMQTRVILDQYNTLSTEICDACGNEKDLEKCEKCTVPVIEYPDPEEEEDDSTSQATTCTAGSTSSCSGGT